MCVWGRGGGLIYTKIHMLPTLRGELPITREYILPLFFRNFGPTNIFFQDSWPQKAVIGMGKPWYGPSSIFTDKMENSFKFIIAILVVNVPFFC